MQYIEIFSAVKIENFIGKFLIFFLKFAKNIDCGYTLEPPRRGGSNEYPQSMFWSKNNKNRYTPCIPQFCYINVGNEWVYLTRTCFPDVVVLPVNLLFFRLFHLGFRSDCAIS